MPPSIRLKTLVASKGFTLIELVVVIVILGILALIAAPKFIGLSTEVRQSTLAGLMGSIKTANTLVYARSKMTSLHVQAVINRDDLIDIDIDNDGVFETRLKWGYLDNTDIEKWIIVDNAFTIQYQGIAVTYIGYDKDDNGQVINDNCYFSYTQAANADTAPEYKTVVSGC
ncbi:prepilin-type N-terminal cleavage/methylation domain-containing protein [Shewanella sp. SG41-4]|uniref:type II secretion system protein n=1 Tax=Shewanella sp. SG41-4 TaxID=2760976 RepID=UPI0015FF8E71|nr:prepilin-type N-terminal cleavage/methylation domain-containing protein [Shewanella sp. SG41-4]MBB1438119.1 prepilin-type N-terminal cleavage/methylation domain-containing protein [Shewanella sp. SG41-4]